MVKKRKKKDLLERILFGKSKRKRKVKVDRIKFRAVSSQEIRRSLRTRVERTAQRILDNPRASEIEKVRARRILSQ